MRVSYLVVSVFFLVTSGCSKKTNDSAGVRIQLDASLFKGTPSSSFKVTSANTTDDGPDWGLADPQRLADIGCWGVLVRGPELPMKANTCELGNGLPLRFGPRAGFYPIGQQGQVQVPVGSDRVFVLVGMRSADGSCQPDFANNVDLDFPNYSAPFVLGTSAPQSIEKDGQLVQIPLQNQFSNLNKIADCDFIDDHDGGTNQGLTLSLEPFPSDRNLWIADNPLPRRVQINTNGTEVTCSRDGTNYSTTECPSGTHFEWTETEYTNLQTIYVRARNDEGEAVEEEFTPSTEYPGLVFTSCDVTFNTSGNLDDGTYSTLNSQLMTNNQVVCFGSGLNLPTNITVTEGAINLGPIDLTGDGIIMIAGQGHNVTLVNGQLNQDLLYINMSMGSKVVGLNFESHASTGGWATIILNSSQDVSLENIRIMNSWNAGQGVRVANSGDTTAIQLINSEVVMSAGGTAVFGYQAAANLEIVNSHLFSNGRNIHLTQDASCVVEGSHIENTGMAATNHLFYGINGGNFVANNSIFVDGSGGGFSLDGATSGTVTVEVNNNIFIRRASGLLGDRALFYGGSSPGAVELLNSTSNGNAFCAEAPANHSFNPVVGFDLDGGSFVLASQVDNGAVGICPP
jgi:hypothetical protein